MESNNIQYSKLFKSVVTQKGYLKLKRRVLLVLKGFVLYQYKREDIMEEAITLEYVTSLTFGEFNGSFEITLTVDGLKEDIIYFSEDFETSFQWFVCLRFTILYLKDMKRSLPTDKFIMFEGDEEKLKMIEELTSYKTTEKTSLRKIVNSLSTHIKDIIFTKQNLLVRKSKLETYLFRSRPTLTAIQTIDRSPANSPPTKGTSPVVNNFDVTELTPREKHESDLRRFIYAFRRVIDKQISFCQFKLRFIIRRLIKIAQEQERQYFDYEYDFIYLTLSKDPHLRKAADLYQKYVQEIMEVLPSCINFSEESLKTMLGDVTMLYKEKLGKMKDIRKKLSRRGRKLSSPSPQSSQSSQKGEKRKNNPEKADESPSSDNEAVESKSLLTHYYILRTQNNLFLSQIQQLEHVIRILRKIKNTKDLGDKFSWEEYCPMRLFDQFEFVYYTQEDLLNKLERRSLITKTFFNNYAKLQRHEISKSVITLRNLNALIQELEKQLESDISEYRKLTTKRQQLENELKNKNLFLKKRAQEPSSSPSSSPFSSPLVTGPSQNIFNAHASPSSLDVGGGSLENHRRTVHLGSSAPVNSVVTSRSLRGAGSSSMRPMSLNPLSRSPASRRSKFWRFSIAPSSTDTQSVFKKQEYLRVRRQYVTIKEYEITRKHIELIRTKQRILKTKCKIKELKISEMKEKKNVFFDHIYNDLGIFFDENGNPTAAPTPSSHRRKKHLRGAHRRTKSNISTLSTTSTTSTTSNHSDASSILSSPSSINQSNGRNIPKRYTLLYRYLDLDEFFLDSWQLLLHRIILEENQKVMGMEKKLPVISHSLSQQKKEKVLDELRMEVFDVGVGKKKSELTKAMTDFMEKVIKKEDERALLSLRERFHQLEEEEEGGEKLSDNNNNNPANNNNNNDSPTTTKRKSDGVKSTHGASSPSSTGSGRSNNRNNGDALYSLKNVKPFIKYMTDWVCKKRKNYQEEYGIEKSEIYEVLESAVFATEIYDKSLRQVRILFATEDSRFLSRCREVRVNILEKTLPQDFFLEHLKKHEKDRDQDDVFLLKKTFRHAIEMIMDLNEGPNQKSPVAKMKAITCACKYIIHSIIRVSGKKEETIGADDFLPILICVIAVSEIPNLISQLEFIEKYRSEELVNSEHEFYYCGIKSACKFIEDFS